MPRPSRACYIGAVLSIVIPTLNAAAGLAATLRGVAGADEIVVADGGSGDMTIAIAREHGARAIDAPRGRGAQLSAGAEAARGDWLLFLHADTRLEPGWREVVGEHQARAPRRAGYFRFALDDASAAARRLERMVAWRCRVFALPYGDQGLLIARALYREVGGFRPLPLMEDVELARRLGRARLMALPVAAVTSASRYRRDGYLRRSARNLACLSLYLAGVDPARIARLYR